MRIADSFVPRLSERSDSLTDNAVSERSDAIDSEDVRNGFIENLRQLGRSRLLLLAGLGEEDDQEAVFERLLRGDSIRSVKIFVQNQRARSKSIEDTPKAKPILCKDLVLARFNPGLSGLASFEISEKSLPAWLDLNLEPNRKALAAVQRNLLAAVDSGLSQLFPDRYFAVSLSVRVDAEPVSFSSSLKEKHKKEDKDIHAALQTWFEKNFWPAYPKRNGRKNGKSWAWKWVKANLADADETQLAELMTQVEAYAAEHNGNGKFVKNPERWLSEWQPHAADIRGEPICLTCKGSGQVEGRDENKRLIAKPCEDCGGNG